MGTGGILISIYLLFAAAAWAAKYWLKLKLTMWEGILLYIVIPFVFAFLIGLLLT